MTRTVGGVLPAMVTPFDGSGALDQDAAAALIRRLLSEGADGLVLTGTTGEGSTVTDDEDVVLWEIGVEIAREVGGTIVAGTGTNDTRHSVELTERAANAGVDAALVVTPYYNRPNPAGLKAHYAAVAAATDLPIVLYNIPHRTGTDMPNDFLSELAELETVVAVKQANTANLAPVDGLDLLCGNDDEFAQVLDMGGTGGILVAANLVPGEFRRMMDEPGERASIQEGLMPLIDALGVTPLAASTKAALTMMGQPVGGPRLPLVEPSEAEQATIRGALEAHGLLERV